MPLFEQVSEDKLFTWVEDFDFTNYNTW